MQPFGKMCGQRVIDHTMTGDTRCSPECLGNDVDTDMATARRVSPRMACMFVRIILDPEFGGRKMLF